jgi:hypothetical protein
MSGSPAAFFSAHDATQTYNEVARCMMKAAAVACDDCFERRFLLAGHVVTLSVMGREAGQLLYAPFAHLQAAGQTAQPDLRVQAMDFQRYGPPAMGDTFGVSKGRPEDATIASHDGRFIVHVPSASGSVWALDRASGWIAGALASPQRLSAGERGRPLQQLFEFWFGEGRRQVLHAGLVCADGQGVLFAGSSGCGKSTSALCCLLGGLGYLGDDRVVLEQRDGGFVGHSMYGVVWLDPVHLERFPEIPAGAAGEQWDDPKKSIFVGDLFPDRLPPSVPIQHVILPKIRGDGVSSLRPATRGEALRYLAPSCVVLGPRLGKRGFDSLTRLVQSCQCHWLDLGADLSAVATKIRALTAAAGNGLGAMP